MKENLSFYEQCKRMNEAFANLIKVMGEEIMKPPMRFRRFLCWLLGHRSLPSSLNYWYGDVKGTQINFATFDSHYCCRCLQRVDIK